MHRDDLASAGYAALVTAAQAFDPTRGIPFGRFAAVRVRGALLDELRGMDWASRSVRARARRADVARQELTAQLGRTPTPTELAELLGVGGQRAGHRRRRRAARRRAVAAGLHRRHRRGHGHRGRR